MNTINIVEDPIPTPKVYLTAYSPGGLKTEINKQEIQDKIQSIYLNIKAIALNEIGKTDTDIKDVVVDLNSLKSSVVVILKNDKKISISLLAEKELDGTTKKIQDLINQGKTILKDDKEICEKHHFHSFAKEEGADLIRNPFSSREKLIHNPLNFIQAAKILEPQINNLSPQAKQDFFTKLCYAAHAYKELKNHYQAKKDASIDPDLQTARDDAKAALETANHHLSNLNRELDELEKKLRESLIQAEADSNPASPSSSLSDEELNRQITAKQEEITAKNEEITELIQKKEDAEKPFRPQEQAKLILQQLDKIDAFAISTALLHSNDQGLSDAKTGENITKTIESSKESLKKQRSWKEFLSHKYDGSEQVIKNYAADIHALSRQVDHQLTQHYFAHTAPIAKTSLAESLIMRAVQLKLDPSLDRYIKDLDGFTTVDEAKNIIHKIHRGGNDYTNLINGSITLEKALEKL